MSDHVLPQEEAPKLIVVAAFDRNEEGDLVSAYGPEQQQARRGPFGPPEHWRRSTSAS